jgi:translation initiation factor IF-2
VRGGKARLLRDNIIVFEGGISGLKRFKDDVREVEKGFECGVTLENYTDIKAGDVIEVITQESTASKLNDTI